MKHFWNARFFSTFCSFVWVKRRYRFCCCTLPLSWPALRPFMPPALKKRLVRNRARLNPRTAAVYYYQAKKHFFFYRAARTFFFHISDKRTPISMWSKGRDHSYRRAFPPIISMFFRVFFFIFQIFLFFPQINMWNITKPVFFFACGELDD